MTRRFDIGYIVAALLPLIGILPTLAPGVIDTADGPLHVQRIHAMSTMLGAGTLYPRWIPWFHLGYGYPIFNFYPPGMFYLGGLLGQLGISATTAFTLVAALAWVVGSVGAYHLARRFLPAHAALLAAMLWAYAPSRLFEVWDQGSLPQMMAAALIPWLFAGILRAAYQPTRRSALAAALPLAGIFLCHQPVTFIVALFAAPLAVVAPLWAVRANAKNLLPRYAAVFGGLLLGVGLAAIFLIPLAAELRYVQAAGGAQDNVDYLVSNFLQPHDLFIQPPAADLTDLRYELPTTLGLLGGVLTIPGLVALARRRQYGALALLMAGLAFTLFMLVEPSLPVWLTIPFFRQLRFPERFLRVGALLIALVGAASLLHIPATWQRAVLGVALIVVLVAGLPMAYPNQKFLAWDNLTAQDEIRFELATSTWGTTSYDEFDPIWGDDIPLPTYVPEEDEYATTPLRVVVNRVDMARYGDIMQVEQVDTQAVRVTLTQAHPVRFHQYYFPGWTATLDGAPADIYADAQFGLITLDVPPGEHTIRLAYAGTTAQSIGALVTLASTMIAATLFVTSGTASRAESGGGLDRRTAMIVGGGVIAFALVNTLVITPNTLLFRHRSPPDAPVYMQTPVHASFGDTFELLGYTLEQTSAAPGDLFSVTLFWRAEHEIERTYRPVVQLVNLPVSEAWAVSEPFFPGGGPTIGYTPDRFASEVHEMRVFETTPPYVGRVMVQMLDVETGEPLTLDDGADRLVLEPLVRIVGNGQPVANRFGVVFGESVALHCADVERDGDENVVHVYWHVLKTPAQDVVTFVHGLDANGDTIANGDAPPLNGAYPPSLWLPGQTLADEYRVPYDAAITQIAVGLYTPGDGTRLPALQAGTPLTDNRAIVELGGAPCQP